MVILICILLFVLTGIGCWALCAASDTDEYDDEERTYVKLNDRTYIFEAKTLLSDFYKIMKIDSNIFERVEGDADTLAGLLLEIKGEFPVLHEHLDYENYHFEVLEMNTRRILKVKVIVDEPQVAEETK